MAIDEIKAPSLEAEGCGCKIFLANAQIVEIEIVAKLESVAISLSEFELSNHSSTEFKLKKTLGNCC